MGNCAQLLLGSLEGVASVVSLAGCWVIWRSWRRRAGERLIPLREESGSAAMYRRQVVAVITAAMPVTQRQPASDGC